MVVVVLLSLPSGRCVGLSTFYYYVPNKLGKFFFIKIVYKWLVNSPWFIAGRVYIFVVRAFIATNNGLFGPQSY